MRYWSTLALLVFMDAGAGAVVVDRVAVIVGKHVIKTSDIDRELRVSSFLNRQPLDPSPAAMRKAADRLIDQELVREDLLNGQYAQPTEQDVDGFLQQLKRDRFAGSDTRLQAELKRYDLTMEKLRRHLLWQLTVLRFIDQRFRIGVLVTDEDTEEYYRAHRADLQRSNPRETGPRDTSLDALRERIRETVTAERIDQAFEQWLAESRRGIRIEYRQPAFGAESTQ